MSRLIITLFLRYTPLADTVDEFAEIYERNNYSYFCFNHWKKYDNYTYRVTWSADDNEHIGLCSEFPSLSWLAEEPKAALKDDRFGLPDYDLFYYHSSQWPVKYTYRARVRLVVAWAMMQENRSFLMIHKMEIKSP